MASVFVMLATPLASGQQLPDDAGRNWLPNPSFEEEWGGQPSGWQPQTWGGAAKFEHARAGHTGARSVLITSEQGADVAWTCLAVVEPYATYRLSGWIRTENVVATTGKGALFNIHGVGITATPALTGTNDWTRVEVVFETHEDDAVQVNCLFGGWGLATGRAWYDDIRLEQLSRTTPPAPRISIDAGRVGAPISKYIYGQFIEHLGRCIYGGIWAEMLEDRKFFYPVGAGESPWRVIGPDGTVTTATSDMFVGVQTPQITLRGSVTGGISQGDLALQKDRRYVGRIWLAGADTVGPVRVALAWGDGPDDRQTIPVVVSGAYAKTPLEFTAGVTTENGRLEISAGGTGSFRVGTVSLMPADNVQGMRADTLAVLRDLNAPVYRWPGGNFVSGYDWQDGVGDPDRRPPRKNPAWQGVEHHDFGVDEFLTFCRLVNAEPYIAVNSGLGDVQNAAAEVEYVNGGADTPLGRRRAANGHAEPYGVKFWGIGNEMYGDWQLGHIPLEQYTQRHNAFAAALRKVDPSIRLVGVGAVGAWTEGMLRVCGDSMDLVSEHFYCGERPGLNGHMRQIPGAVRGIAEAHRRYRRDLAAREIPIALDEWNYWYGPHVFGELGTRYFLKDALGVAAGLHELSRNSDLFFMANYAQTVNVIGCVKASKTAAALETTGLVLKLYRAHFGTLPVATEVTPQLDAAAALTADRRVLTLGVVNPSAQALEIALDLHGVKLNGSGTRWQIAGADPLAYNDPGRPDVVRIEEQPVRGLADVLRVPACSVTLLALDVE